MRIRSLFVDKLYFIKLRYLYCRSGCKRITQLGRITRHAIRRCTIYPVCYSDKNKDCR